MKLHFVLQQIERAIFAIDSPHRKEAVKQYLYAAKAELKRFCPTSQRGVVCQKEKQKCPFMEYDGHAAKCYCTLSQEYLKRDEDGYLEPNNKGCTWQE